MICIYTGKLSFSPKYRSALYNLISKVTLPCWSWVKACLKLWKFRNLTKYAKRFLIGTRTKICSGNKGINFKYELEALNWVELECEGRLQSTLFKRRGDSGLMFGASLDRQYCPDVRPVFGKPSHIWRKTTQIFYKTGVKLSEGGRHKRWAKVKSML